MVVSFNISKKGKRYPPGQLPKNEDNQVDSGTSSCCPADYDQPMQNETRGNTVEVGDKVEDQSAVLANPEPRVDQLTEDLEVSFALNLFPDGFSVGDAAEVLDDIPNMLRPYDRESKKLLSAIEYGYLPGDYFDDLPCKYVKGTLLCEIRDFRDCLDQTGDSASLVRKSPILHKAVLKMSMENIIKDISSISDDTWTYKDRLEFESRIIKVMHPDLCLNPKPVEDIFSGKFMTKMPNLEIPWSSRKRKLIDTEETSSASSIKRTSTVVGVLNYEPLQRLEILDEGSDMLPEHYIINHTSSPREPGTSVPIEEGRCEKQTERLIFKKPKEEPVEFSREYLSCMVFKTILAPEAQQKEKQLLKSYDSEKLKGENQSSLKIRDGHQENLEGLPQLLGRVLAYPVKQESESTPGSDIGCQNQKSQMHQSSSVSKTINVPSNSIQLNDVGRPVEQNLITAVAQEIRIPLQEPLTSIAVGSASVNASCGYIDSLLRYSPVLGKRKLNSHLQSLGMNIVESLPSTRDMKLASTSSSPAGNSSSPWPLGSKDDPILERFSKIKMVTQRYGLHERKKKAGDLLDRKPFFRTPFQVAYNLMSENNDLKAATEDVSQTRKLNFVRPSHFIEGSEASVLVGETQTKLVLSESLEDGTVGRVLYGQGEERDPCEFPLETNFVSTHEIDKLAAQFVSLMAREGFILTGDKVESSPGSTEQGSTSQRRPSVSSRATSAGTVVLPSPATIPRKSTACMPRTSTRSMQTPNPQPLTYEDVLTGGHLRQPSVNISSASATERIEPLISTQIPGQSPYMFSSEISSMPVFHPRQFPSQDFLAGTHSMPSGNFLSALQPSANYSSSPLLNNAVQVSHFELQWQQIIESLVQLQFQMQERERQQQQLIHRHVMLRGLPTALDYLAMRHLGVGNQGSPNPYLGYLSNMDTGGPSSVNFGQVNYLGSNILGFNGNNQALGGIYDPSDAAAPAWMIEQSQQRPLPRGVLVQSNNIAGPSTYGMARQPPMIRTNHDLMALHPPLLPDHVSRNMLLASHRNAGIMPMYPPVVPGMVHNFPYQQPPPAQIQERLQQQHQRINPPLQVQAAADSVVALEIMDLSFPQVGSAMGSSETSAMVASDDESEDFNS